MNTNDEHVINQMKKQFNEYKINFNGNINFLGIPHGTSQYVNE